MNRVTIRDFLKSLNWIDGTPLMDRMEPYRLKILEALDSYDARGRLLYTLALWGRGKKNWKTADLVLYGLFCLVANESRGGNQVYLLANDLGQAGDDLSLAKKIVAANPWLDALVTVQANVINRVDEYGFMMILPANDAAGLHGKTYKVVLYDEIHGYRNWDLMEAMQPDPTRPDTQQVITSYASLYHKPGVPLYDLIQKGKAGTPKMLFSWYAADHCTDPEFANLDPESRANPSRKTWENEDYLVEQAARLPAHKYRRLHLNLPGLPEGSAFTAEKIMAAIDRGISVREPMEGIKYMAAVDMSGGSRDNAVLTIGHEENGVMIQDRIMNQGPQPPFEPDAAVSRFAAELHKYGVRRVHMDKYGGETFSSIFRRLGIEPVVETKMSASDCYEAFEPLLNGGRIVLLDETTLEQEFLGLVWRGNKIDHPANEHDDFSNATALLAVKLLPVKASAWAEVSSVTKSTFGRQVWVSRVASSDEPEPTLEQVAIDMGSKHCACDISLSDPERIEQLCPRFKANRLDILGQVIKKSGREVYYDKLAGERAARKAADDYEAEQTRLRLAKEQRVKDYNASRRGK